MRVMTNQSIMFDFGLSGKDTQEDFNIDKYKAIAYSSPVGTRMMRLVEERWPDWVRLVDDAPWLRNWSKSVLNADSERTADWLKMGRTPMGNTLPSNAGHQTRIALVLFVEAVWGYGVMEWFKTVDATDESGVTRSKIVHSGSVGTDTRVKSNSAVRTIWKMQNIHCPSQSRKYLVDDAIYRGTGLVVPSEFGDLDRWLEPIWNEALMG